MAKPIRFEGPIPATLGFIKTAEQHLHLLMQGALGMIARLLAVGTVAQSHVKRCHTPLLMGQPSEPTHGTPAVGMVIRDIT
jgi:hypothetical protein